VTWWYVSSPRLTGAVKVEDGRVVEGPPVLRRFVGQPAKSLGSWLRQQGECSFARLANYDHLYIWGNNEKRATLKGRPCRILARGTMRSVMVEFEDGERVICSHRALRRRTT
jgi:hypothetical protein